MNKKDLIEIIVKENGLTKAAAERVLNTTTEAIKKAVTKGDAVQLIGFGTFSSTKRAARAGRNPATGAALKIKASVSPKFKAGTAFKNAVNKRK